MLRRHRVPETLAPTRMPVNFTMYRRGPGHTGRPGEAQPVPTVATASRAGEDAGAGASISSVSPRSRFLPAPWGGPRDTFGIVFSLLVLEAQGILKTENTCAGLITERMVMPISLVLITFPRLGTPISSQDLFPAPAQHGGGKGRRIPGLSWNTCVRRRRHLPPRVDRWRPAWRSTGRCTQTPPVGIRGS